MDTQQVLQRIQHIRDTYASRLHILGHYYMHPDILTVVDSIGDSYQLAKRASLTGADYVVFCGVFFMAESARLMCKPRQRIFIPEPDAGCPLADTITPEYFHDAMNRIKQKLGEAPIPVVYVNSTAQVKALAGQAEGSCCTSANAADIIESIVKEGKRVFFLPDQNLGWNVGRSLGLGAAEMRPLYEKAGCGELDPGTRLILWDGYCPIHQRFSLKDVRAAREKYPGCCILVHPECTSQVVEASDFSGSTSQLLHAFEEAESSSTLVIGTEINFIRRLQKLRPDVTVHPLRESQCRNMSKITPLKLLNTLMSLEEDNSFYEVFVAEEITPPARDALRRMIHYVEKGK